VCLPGHPGDDLIDVLDESAIQLEFPDYPGHEEAQRRWRQEIAAGALACDGALERASTAPHAPGSVSE